ncbi:MAG: xylan 1,4-beta-xylosidase, partial [Lachnospiraceae bacterium]|nr:xylan 1,4-beta-xylosidase [Lachnospiraceae bacterium]
RTFDAVKEVDDRFRVGGPAVCGGSDEKWIQAFMEYCHHHKIAVDFVTRHHYTIEQPKTVGHYDYSVLMNPEEGVANLKTSRDIIDSFPEYQNLPIHITEFNTSYTPKGVIHDTNLNAAFIARQLSRLGDVNESYSYWTFGDVFEEQGVPFTPFHGGFGLVAEGCIPKPTFWTFAFYKKLKDSNGQCVYKDDNIVVLRRGKNDYLGVAWNIVRRTEGILSKESEEAKEIRISMPACDGGYSFLMKTVDEETCNPLKVWHDLGEPACLNEEQKKLLREAAMPYLKTERLEAVDGSVCIALGLNRNAVVYFEVNRSEVIPDRGYDYERVKAGE